MPASSNVPHHLRLAIAAAIAVVLLAVVPLSGGSRAVANAPQQTPTPQPARLILLTDPVPDPKEPGVVWFAPTGHTLRGAFRDYWNRYGGLAQFGYPLTEEFVEQDELNVKAYTVQYFERARFEHHPENKGTEYEVLLGTLGRDLRAQDPPASPLPAPALYFQETGHNLSGPFKAYWETHGGLFVNGYPITEAFQETNPIDGKSYLVQYFERSRLEYHPENAGSPYEVLLGLLGTQSVQRKGYAAGAYPPYGQAADFSWLAGHFVPYRMCAPTECSCPLFDYGRITTLVGPNWLAAREAGQLRIYKPVVLFGYLGGATENDLTCRSETYFYVELAQQNPLPTGPAATITP